MRKKLLSAVVALIIMLSSIVPVFAGPGDPPPTGPVQPGIGIIICCDYDGDYCECEPNCP